MTSAPAPKVLCVDDEPEILTGLRLQLRAQYQVLIANSGEEALALIDQHPDLAVILSDMRMPEMDGASFLARARKRLPAASRILLTGYADTQAAIRAVNQGHLFRFLTKPCPPEELLTVVRAAAAQHRLLLAEKELLEQTLLGSIEALSDALALALPEIYGGIAAIRRLADDLGRRAQLEPIWPLRAAAMLIYTGYVGLPREVAMRAVAGEVLTGEEAAMLADAPRVTAQLLSGIPRLEPVCRIIELAHGPGPVPAEAAGVEPGAQAQAGAILRLAQDYCRLRAQELSPQAALERLDEQVGRHDRATLDLLREHVGAASEERIVELALGELRLGMTLAEGLKTHKGVLVAARGYVVTPGFLERIRNFPRGSLIEPVRVLADAPDPDSAA